MADTLQQDDAIAPYRGPLSAGMFAGAGTALAVWAALTEIDRQAEIHVRRGLDGRCLVIVGAAPARTLPLLAAFGGLLYVGTGTDFHAVRASGAMLRADDAAAGAIEPAAVSAVIPDANDSIVLDSAGQRWRLDAEAWPSADILALLGGLAMTPGQPAIQPGLAAKTPRAQLELGIFVPTGLGRYILRRILNRGFLVTLTPARWRPLHTRASVRDSISASSASVAESTSSAPASTSSAWVAESASSTIGGLWFVIKSRTNVLSPSIWLPFCDLPGVVVARAADVSASNLTDARLCIDIRYSLPVSETAITRLFGDRDESHGCWLLAGPEIGHGCIEYLAAPVDANDMMTPPDMHTAPPISTAEVNLPAPISVQLTRATGGYREPTRDPGPADAVLVDERELGWLRSYLMTRPINEHTYLIPGAREHLVIHLGSSPLPFGCPLRREGARGLYIEHGYHFVPPLPADAQTRTFGLEHDDIVVLSADRSLRFDARNLVPAWTMWVGPGPTITPAEVRGDEHDRARLAGIIESIEAQLGARQEREAPRFVSIVDNAPAAGAPVTQEERTRLRDEAAADLVRGHLAQAAYKLERAGDAASAARLYERAARAADGEDEPAPNHHGGSDERAGTGSESVP